MPQSITRLLTAPILIAVFALASSAQQVAPIREQPLRVVEYSGDMSAFLSHLPSIFNTCIAFEIDPLEIQTPLTFRVKEATFEDVLNAIVKAKPRYSWRRDGDTVEIYPVQHPHPLLDTRISSLRINNIKLNEALQQVLSSTEVRGALLNSGLRLAPMVRRVDDQDQRFSISADDITLRQALDEIAESSGARFWVFQLIGPNRDSVFIRF